MTRPELAAHVAARLALPGVVAESVDITNAGVINFPGGSCVMVVPTQEGAQTRARWRIRAIGAWSDLDLLLVFRERVRAMGALYLDPEYAAPVPRREDFGSGSIADSKGT